MILQKYLSSHKIFQLLIAVIVTSVSLCAFINTPTYAASRCTDNTYSKGISGTCVKYIQILANHKLKYYSNTSTLKVDSQYGSKTVTGIKKVQSEMGLSKDGVVGQDTWFALCYYRTSFKSGAGYHSFTAAEAAADKSAGCSKFSED